MKNCKRSTEIKFLKNHFNKISFSMRIHLESEILIYALSPCIYITRKLYYINHVVYNGLQFWTER